MTSAVDYLVLAVTHRTNEDWFLACPLAIPASELVGATAACRLWGPAGAIDLVASIETIDGAPAIVTRADSEVFAGRGGAFSGDVLLTLAGGRDVVTHLVNLNLQRGISRHG